MRKKHGATEKTSYRVYVQRDDILNEGHDYYVRGTLSISEMNSIKQIRARSLLVVDETEPLAAMLRDSEPPAHTLWRPRTPRVTDHWVAADRRIPIVRNTPRMLLQALQTPSASIQKNAFADIFPSTRTSSQPSDGRGRRRNDGRVNRPPRNSKSSDFEIHDTQSGTGFRVRIAQAATTPPEYAHLQVAYEVPRGNPLKRYQPTDFRLHGEDALDVSMNGCELVDSPSSGDSPANEMRLRITDPRQFALTVQGFDPNRDVHVKVDRWNGGDAADDTQI